MGNTDVELFKKAYKKLKSSIYFDKTQLILRNQIVDFEAGIDDFDTFFENFEAEFNDEDKWKILSDKILKSISVVSMPKKIMDEKNEEGFITNSVSKELKIDEVQYFINMDVRGHILGVLWLMLIGYHIDEKVYEHSYGNRIRKKLYNELSEQPTYSPYLFEPYFEQYESWRDTAMDYACDNLKNSQDVVIITMDFKRFYYSVDINKDAFEQIFQDAFEDIDDNIEDKEFLVRLNDFLSALVEKYSSLFDVDEFNGRRILPIGFLPSNVIANWCLRNFDKAIVDGWNPVYFGRYVDDVLIVDKIAHNSDIYNKAKENKVTGEDIIHFFLEQCSKWKGIGSNECGNNCEFALLKELLEKSKEKQYVLNKRYNPREDDNSQIIVQNNKVKIFYFKSGETDALIRCFREKIVKNKSEFRHMPEDENVFQKGDYREIYNLQNSETINKFRGIEGVSIDKFELSKFIGKHLRIDGMVEDKKESNFEKEISKIFNIRIIIENYTMWEKIIEIFVINERFEVLKTFVQNILKAIDSVTYVNQYTTTTDKLKEGLHFYLESAIYRPFALVWGAKYHSIIEDIGKLIFEKIKFDSENLIFSLLQSKRQAYCSTRMIDKSVMPVFIDMLEIDELFTDKINVNLTKFNEVINIVKKKFDVKYLFYPYILTMYDISMISCIEQFQEELPFYDICKMHENQMEYYIHRNYSCLNNRVEEEIKNFVKIEEIKDVPKGFRVEVGKNKKNKLKIAIANVKLSYNNFELLMRDNPNRSYQRYMEISKIVNQAIDEHADMLIMPESFVPYEWLNTLARTCARNKLAVVTGVEHVKFGSRIFNLTAVILPYDDLNYRSALISFHLKTHYAPAEKQAINGYRFEAVEGEFYELYKWNSCYFPVYCCYELTSINDRALFQSHADFLVAIEWNKDVKYYSNILESLSRDIHCYCIQVNSSNYGDSRITSPSKTEEKDIIRTKGGINSTILVGEIDIFKLRIFQIKGYELQKQSKEFKTVPPGFKCDIVLDKIKES